MADQILDIQIKFSGGVKSPLVTGDRRLTLMNLAKLIYGLNHGSQLSQGANYLQVQPTIVAASATATPAAVASADTLSIAGQALTATQKRATGYVTCATAIAGNTFVLNGVTFTGAAGAVVLGEATFSIDTSDAATCTSIIAQVNAYVDPRLSGIVAARATVGNTARPTFYAITQGTGGNGITLVGTASTLVASAATLTGGAAIANNAFDWAGTNATTGAALAAAINASTTTAVKQVTATADATTGVVTVTSKVGGLAGNTLTFTSNDGTRLAVTGSGFLATGSAGVVTRWTL